MPEAIISTMENSGHLIEGQSNSKSDLCPWESADACKHCTLDCNNKRIKKQKMLEVQSKSKEYIT